VNEIILHQPPTRAWGTPNLSPFCIKLETYLRMAEVPYKPGKFVRGDAPKGKVPYIRLDDKLLGDSQLIIEELERQLGAKALDRELSPRDAALGRLARRTLEEAFYFIGVYFRWRDEAGYAEMTKEFKKFVPGIVLPLVRRAQNKKLEAQGTGRHTAAEVAAMGIADFDAIAELLGDKPFFLGDAPRTVDCTLFAFLEAVLPFPIDSPLKDKIKGHANLVAYRQRVRDRWWKDLTA
jgi:glutathione S-transferase